MRLNDAIVALALAGIVLVGGCKKKTPKPVVAAPEIQQPASAPSEAPVTPAEADEPLPTAPIEETQVEPDSATSTKPAPAKPRKTRNGSKSGAAKTPQSSPAAQSAQTQPPKITIEPGNNSPNDGSGPISPGGPHSEDQHHRQSTAQLLQSTEENLNSIKRELSADEQGLAARIRSFMAESRTATQENDAVRAHNLALKAHLLSDELVRQ
jgi:hypothetical protein